MIYTYSIQNDIAAQLVNESVLAQEIEAQITTSLIQISVDGDVLDIEFSSVLTTQEATDLPSIINNHTGDTLELYKGILKGAILFWDNLFVEFVAENISMGITQAGKTKAVSDYLEDVKRYGDSGSLYTVMSEIDALITAGIPQDLAPFVTDARMTAFKNRIVEYLS